MKVLISGSTTVISFIKNEIQSLKNLHMKLKHALIFSVVTLGGQACLAQSNVTEDFKPSTLNQPGQVYPQVNSQGYARFRIVAPYADSVKVSLGLGGRG